MNRKQIFDTVRAMLGRGFKPEEVAALDDAIDAAMRPDPPSEPERDETPAQTSPAGIAFIKQFEGFRADAYPDPGTGGKPWTIGWGSTTDEQGKPIKPGDRWSKSRADQRFAQHLMQFEQDVIRALGSAIHGTSQKQFDALVSFHYNTGAIARATLTKLHKAGEYRKAADEFLKWNKAGGKVLTGLTRRRQAERAMYLEGTL